MKIKPMSRYMRSLSNEKLAEYLPVRKKGKDGKEETVAVSLFSREAQAEASRRARKHVRAAKKAAAGPVRAKAA